MMNNKESSLNHNLAEGLREQTNRTDISFLLKYNHNIPQKSIVKFKKQGSEFVHQTTGRYGQTLFWLIKHKEQGITAQEVSSWALRLASYIFWLRGRFKLEIQTVSEPHDGGKHARYFLKDDIELIEISLNGKSLIQ